MRGRTGVRKRKQSPLGPARIARSIPITAAEPVSDRRPLIPLEPSLAELASGLLPNTPGSEPAAWTSWALKDQPSTDGFSYWEAPIVDGRTCSGDGVGFPEQPADTAPITIDDVTSAAAAGWPYDPGTPLPDRSWVRVIGGLGLDSDETPADAPHATSATATPDHPAAAWPPFERTDVRDAMALHPSAQHIPEADVVVPPPATPPFDAADFVTRLERGAAIALTEPHLHALAGRALERLAPRASATWFAEQPHGRLTVAFSSGGDHAGCGVVDRQSCPAIATGAAQRFDRSDELDACPVLLARAGAPCAAVCAPVRSPGPLRGVLFVSAPATAPLDDATLPLVEHVTSTIARRVAEVRNAVGSSGPTD